MPPILNKAARQPPYRHYAFQRLPAYLSESTRVPYFGFSAAAHFNIYYSDISLSMDAESTFRASRHISHLLLILMPKYRESGRDADAMPALMSLIISLMLHLMPHHHE